MSAIPFIDVHSHHLQPEKDTIRVVNLFPGASIPEFKGRNFYSMGLHPWELKTFEENNLLLEITEEAQKLDHVLFLGECGIDKIYGDDQEEQQRVFLAQAMMAEEHQKPMIIHCVRAYNEIIDMYKQIKPSVPWILHGFTGNIQLSQQLEKIGFYFSFGKILLKPAAKVVEAFEKLSIEKIFLETDEFEDSISKIYNIAAEIKNISVEELKESVWKNFNRLENVSLSTDEK